jgi:hypothetical protein
MAAVCVGDDSHPCLNGMSNMPDEYGPPEQVAAGTAVLLESVLRLNAID